MEATGRTSVPSLAQAHYVPNDGQGDIPKLDNLINAIKGVVKRFVTDEPMSALSGVQQLAESFAKSNLDSLDVSLSLRRHGEQNEVAKPAQEPADAKQTIALPQITRIPRPVTEPAQEARPAAAAQPASSVSKPAVQAVDSAEQAPPATAANEPKAATDSLSEPAKGNNALSSELRALFDQLAAMGRDMGLEGSRLEQLLPHLLDIAVGELKVDPELAGHSALLDRIADEFAEQYQPSAAADAYATTTEFEFSLQLSLTA